MKHDQHAQALLWNDQLYVRMSQRFCQRPEPIGWRCWDSLKYARHNVLQCPAHDCVRARPTFAALFDNDQVIDMRSMFGDPQHQFVVGVLALLSDAVGPPTWKPTPVIHDSVITRCCLAGNQHNHCGSVANVRSGTLCMMNAPNAPWTACKRGIGSITIALGTTAHELYPYVFHWLLFD